MQAARPEASKASLCFAAFLLGGCASSSSGFKSEPERASQINLDLAVDYLRRGNLAVAKEKLDKTEPVADEDTPSDDDKK